MEKEPFKGNKPLRHALAMAIDRTVITELVLGAGQIPAYTFIPPVKDYAGISPEWATWTQEDRDNKAKGLYREAGYDAAGVVLSLTPKRLVVARDWEPPYRGV